MRFWLLSHLEGSPGNARVLEAAQRAGHAIEPVQPQRVLPLIGGRQAALELLDPRAPPGPGGRDDAPPDLVFSRMGGSAPAGALDVVRLLEARRVPCVSGSAALELARDKGRAALALAGAGVPTPETLLLGPGSRLDEVPARLGEPPWVVKLPVSTQGLGVARADSLGSLRTVLDLLRGLDQRVLVQRYVREAAGRDVRVLVLGGRATAAMRREATAPDELRSNLHRGGRAEAVAVTPELGRIAEEAAQALGLDVAGVDLLEADDGPLVVEVNASPGLEGLERATGRDLAAEVVTLLEARAREAWRG